MFKTACKCLDCKQTMYVTKSGRYWCDTCQKEQDANRVDPMGQDIVMNRVIVEIALERALAGNL